MPEKEPWSGADDRRKPENAEERERFAKHLSVALRALELHEENKTKKDKKEPKPKRSVLSW